MHVQIERGLVVGVLNDTSSGRELLVEVGGEVERAFQEPAFGVCAEVGDRVLLNTTAVRLKLGTGGLHFVIAVEKGNDLHRPPNDPADPGQLPGHIMKLRYTPLQMAVHAVEEETHPLHPWMREADSLADTPVVICELHSMLPAVVMSVQHEMAMLEMTRQERTQHESARNYLSSHALPPHQRPCSIVYVMTDGGALPLYLSQTVAALKQKGLLAGTVTVGHAYGGDLEAVNLYSGLLAAKHVLSAACIVVAMGPGIVGTGTRFGHTGIEVGQAVNAVHALAGEAIVVPRLSFADPRDRHHGVSHHTLTALGRVALAQATVPLPSLPDDQATLIQQQLTAASLHKNHRLAFLNGRSILDAAARYQVPLGTMGRSLHQDLAFFLAAGAAGEYVAQRLQAMQTDSLLPKRKNPPERYARREESALLTDKNC